MNRNVRYLITGICISMAMALTGCGSNSGNPETDREEIELHEPRGVSVVTEPVTRRNLYKGSVYEGAVYPYVEEYSFAVDQAFGSYGALMGDTVQKGDVLVYADGEALSEKIESLEEKLQDIEQEYIKFKTKVEEALYIQNLELDRLADILENLERDKPEEFILNEEGEETANPEYLSWQSEYKKWNGEYSLKEQDISVNEESLRQKRELYELDYGYFNGLRKELVAQRKDEQVLSGISGVVVNEALYYLRGTMIARGEAIVAVADMEQKFVKCAQLTRSMLANTVDIYAFIGGKRYEIDLLESNSSGSTFTLSDGAEDVSVGDYAVVVLMADCRRDVLTVSESALFQEGTGYGVYVLENGERVRRQVETGMSDGFYVEILSGLEEGEEVVASVRTGGEKTAVLERKTRELSYTGTGYVSYPLITAAKNSIESGTVTSAGNLLRINTLVEKGEALTAVRVDIDEYDLAAKEIALQRAKERLADLEAEGSEENEETIAARRKEIAEQEKEIAQIKKDAETTEICSPVDGFLRNYAVQTGDVLETDGIVAVIADVSVCYLLVDISENKTLNYGDVLTASYTDTDGNAQKMECRVLTLGKWGADCYIHQDLALLSIPEEALEKLPVTEGNSYGPQISLFRPTGYVNKMEDVVMVPVDAVTADGGTTYVNVLEEDGSVIQRAFLAGGKDKDYYWVIEGLTEGMKVCWE